MKTYVLLALAALALVGSDARADVGEAYGFGSRSAALGGPHVSWGFDAFAAYTNPAAVAVRDGRRLRFGLAFVYMQPSFLPISGVVVENNYTSDKDPPRLGNVDTSYRSTFGQAMGVSTSLAPDMMNLSAGLTAFFPTEQLAYMDTGESFIPEYVLYRSRTQRPQIDLAFAAEPASGLHFGFGGHLAFSLTSTASVFLQTNANKPSTMRFLSSMKPKIVPYIGALYRYGTGDSEPEADKTAVAPRSPSGSGSLGLVLRAPAASKNFMSLNSGARAFGDFAALDFFFASESALYYDPLTLQTGWSHQYSDDGRIFLQIDYQAWSRYVPPSLLIGDPQIDPDTCAASPGNCGIQISGGENPVFEFRDIVVWRAGHEYDLGPFVARGGIGYRPGLMKSLPTGAGNYLDPDKLMISAGAGFKFKSFLGLPAPVNLDLHLAYHHLFRQEIAKAPGDETGAGAGDIKIGAPGYSAGGRVLGGGLSLGFAF